MLRNFLKPADELALMLDQASLSYEREVMFDPKPSPGESRKRRLWRFDFAFSGKVAVEVDGGTWARQGARKCPVCGQVPSGRHSGGRGFEKDCEKLNAAVLLGWRVLRVTPAMIQSGEAIRLVRRIL